MAINGKRPVNAIVPGAGISRRVSSVSPCPKQLPPFFSAAAIRSRLTSVVYPDGFTVNYQ